VADILQSTTRFIAHPAAAEDPWKRRKMDDLILMLKGAMAAEGKVGLMMNVPRTAQDAVLALMPGHTPTLSSLSDPAWIDVVVILSEDEVRKLIPSLKRAGATAIVEFPLNKIID
jgi:ATP phosphoribosyltransferase